MKKLYFIFAALALVACKQNNANQTEGAQANDGAEEEYYEEEEGGYALEVTEDLIKETAQQFIDYVLKGDYDNALTCFDYEYVEEQYNSFLSGRTNQFIGEYLFGFYVDEKGEEQPFTPDLDQIQSITIIEVSLEGLNATVNVTMKDGKSYNTTMDMTIETLGDTARLGLIGAVG
ncbi:MAG: hypothetical protein J6Y82_10440 [Bacteroidales bacterium]|nr:hypothetical protein [Bacteroidales bacterium]